MDVNELYFMNVFLCMPQIMLIATHQMKKSCSISIFCWHSGLPTVADRSASSRAFWVVWRNLSQKLSFNPLNLYNDIISLPFCVLYLKSDAEKIIPKRNFSCVFNRIFWQILLSYSKFIILGLFKWAILKFFAFVNLELPMISFSDHNICNYNLWFEMKSTTQWVGYFKTTSGHLFGNYINISHKTEVLIVISMCLTYLPYLIKNYNKNTIFVISQGFQFCKKKPWKITTHKWPFHDHFLPFFFQLH